MKHNSDNLVTVHDVNVFYKDRSAGLLQKDKRIQVLNGISFSMREGEILGLVGESGSGKSTLAKTILGLTDYTGTVHHGTDHPQMIFQDPYGSLNPGKRIGWILEEPLKLRGGLSKAQRQQKVAAMLGKVGLDERLTQHYPRQLSGGQRQRVCIAGALMLEPKLLIADEPVSALDVTIQAQILELLLSLREEMGLSILFISHDLRLVCKMCSRVLIMNRGRIVEEGEVEKVYGAPQSKYTQKLLQAAGIL